MSQHVQWKTVNDVLQIMENIIVKNAIKVIISVQAMEDAKETKMKDNKDNHAKCKIVKDALWKMEKIFVKTVTKGIRSVLESVSQKEGHQKNNKEVKENAQRIAINVQKKDFVYLVIVHIH